MDLFNANQPVPRPDISRHLPDRFVATSALQKSIRRGNVAAALAASSFLITRNAERFWRRLIVIALEDVGVGDPETVREVLLASGRKTWRAEQGGDFVVATRLVSRLCAAPKCRDACELLVAADLHPRLKQLRTAFLDLSQDALSDILADADRTLAERTLAAWLIAGTRRFPAVGLPEKDGSFAALLDVYRHLGVAEDILEVARLGSTRTQEGHPLSLPLVWLTASASDTVTVEPNLLPASNPIRGWPSEAYDMHCRLGRRAIERFARECLPVRRLVAEHVPASDIDEFVGTAIFRLEGHQVDRRVSYAGSQAILQDAQAAHLTSFPNFPENRVTDVLAVVQDHLDLLHQCRRTVVMGAGQ